MWKPILAIAIGSALGALLRWFLGLKLRTGGPPTLTCKAPAEPNYSHFVVTKSFRHTLRGPAVRALARSASSHNDHLCIHRNLGLYISFGGRVTPGREAPKPF